jgi:hypothetical protein
MRDAVADRVHVVELHASTQPLDRPRQGAERERPDGHLLVSAKRTIGASYVVPWCRRWASAIPRGQVLLERTERVEGLIRQGVAPDVFDAGFSLAFSPARWTGSISAVS